MTVYFGALFQKKDAEKWDGWLVEFTYNKASASDTTYTVSDIMLTGTPDVEENGAVGLDRDPDDWNLTEGLCWAYCDENDKCTFNVHFDRDFKTLDPNDIQLESEAEIFDTVGFYIVYSGPTSTSIKAQGETMQVMMNARALTATLAAFLITFTLF